MAMTETPRLARNARAVVPPRRRHPDDRALSLSDRTVADQARCGDCGVRERGAGFDAERLRQIRQHLCRRDDLGRARSDDGCPTHARPRSDCDAGADGDDSAGAFDADVVRKWKTNRIRARPDQAVDMVEAGGLDAHERFAGVQGTEIVDRHGEHLRTACAGGSSDASLPGKL